METGVTKTLEQRGNVYGDYEGGSRLRADMMNLIKERHYSVHGVHMDGIEIVHIYDIINKVSRLAVSPGHIDTWHDIAGYALLVEEALNGKA